MRRAQEQAEARKTQEAEERQKEKLSSQRQENGEQPGRTIQAEENPSNPPNKPEVRAHNISRSSSEHSWREAALPKERRGKRRPRRKKAPGKTRQVHDSIEDLEKKKLQELKKLVPPAALSQRAAQSGGLRVPDNHGGNENLTQDKSGRLSGEDHRRQSTGRQREVDRSKIVSEGNNERRGLLVGTSNISPRIMHLLQKVRLLCYKDVERVRTILFLLNSVYTRHLSFLFPLHFVVDGLPSLITLSSLFVIVHVLVWSIVHLEFASLFPLTFSLPCPAVFP